MVITDYGIINIMHVQKGMYLVRLCTLCTCTKEFKHIKNNIDMSNDFYR